MHSEGYISWVCVSVNLHLTSGVSENHIMYSTGNEGQKFVWISLKPLRCRGTPLPALYDYLCSWPFWKPRMHINSVLIVCAFSKIHARMAPRFCTLVHLFYSEIHSVWDIFWDGWYNVCALRNNSQVPVRTLWQIWCCHSQLHMEVIMLSL